MQVLDSNEINAVSGGLSAENGGLALIGVALAATATPVLACFALGAGLGLLYANVTHMME